MHKGKKTAFEEFSFKYGHHIAGFHLIKLGGWTLLEVNPSGELFRDPDMFPELYQQIQEQTSENAH